jgi:hypothetical protein
LNVGVKRVFQKVRFDDLHFFEIVGGGSKLKTKGFAGTEKGTYVCVFENTCPAFQVDPGTPIPSFGKGNREIVN